MAEMGMDEQWRRLAALYAEQSDLELEGLREDFDGLTDVAQGALRDEMKRRGIWEVAAAAALVGEAGDDEAVLAAAEERAVVGWGGPGDLIAGGAWVCECEDKRQEALCQFMLERAGIRSEIEPASSGKFGLSYSRVHVAPSEVERARQVLAEPLSPGEIQEFERAREEAASFDAPVCKGCGSDEVMLELNDAGNEWVCPDCGNRWEEMVAVDGAE
jgi:hypothetical protein